MKKQTRNGFVSLEVSCVREERRMIRSEKITLALITLAYALLGALMFGGFWVTDYYAGGMKERIQEEMRVERNEAATRGIR